MRFLSCVSEAESTDAAVAEARLEHADRALHAYQRAAELSPANANYQSALAEMKTYVRKTGSGPLSP